VFEEENGVEEGVVLIPWTLRQQQLENKRTSEYNKRNTSLRRSMYRWIIIALFSLQLSTRFLDDYLVGRN